MIDSTGFVDGKALKGSTDDMEGKHWEEESGDDVKLVNEMVDLCTPYYRYLHEKRVRFAE